MVYFLMENFNIFLRKKGKCFWVNRFQVSVDAEPAWRDREETHFEHSPAGMAGGELGFSGWVVVLC